jgi:hypothetical protein
MSQEENSIEEKKNTGGDSSSNDWESYSYGVVGAIVYIFLLVWILGTFMLYTTKVAQSNILSTNFTSEVKDKIVKANYVREFIISNSKPYVEIGDRTTQQLKFIKPNETLTESILKFFNSNGNIKTSNFNFLHDFLNTIFGTNNLITNKIFGSLYGMNESLLMLLSPFIYFFIFIFYCIFHFYGIGIYQSYKLIKSIMFPDKEDNYFWSNIHPILNFILFPIYLFLIFAGSFGLAFISCFFSIPYAFLSPLMYNYEIIGTNGEKRKSGISTFLMDFMKYKNSFIMILMSIALLNNSGLYLNSTYAAGAFIAIIILAFLGIYNYTNDPSDISQHILKE